MRGNYILINSLICIKSIVNGTNDILFQMSKSLPRILHKIIYLRGKLISNFDIQKSQNRI